MADGTGTRKQRKTPLKQRHETEIEFDFLGTQISFPISPEDIEAFGGAEHFVAKLRARVERIVRITLNTPNEEDLNESHRKKFIEMGIKSNKEDKDPFATFLRAQVKICLKERPTRISYDQYKKWAEENNLVPVDQDTFKKPGENSVQKRFSAIISKNLCVGATITKVDGNGPRTPRSKIFRFTPDCMIHIGETNTGREYKDARNPKDYKLVELINHNRPTFNQ